MLLPWSPWSASPSVNASTFGINRPLFLYVFDSKVIVPTNVAMAITAMHDSNNSFFVSYCE